MKPLLVAGSLLVILAALALWPAGRPATSAQDEGGPSMRTLSVSGQGTVAVVPDVLSAQLGVHTEDADLSAALGANNAKVQAVLDRLHALGVAKEDVQTVNFSIQERRDREGNLTGFFVDHTVRVTLRDLEAAGTVLDEAIRAGANRVSGVQLTLSDPTPFIERARTLAVQDAQAKAAQLAQAAGMTLGRPLTISEAGASVPRAAPRVATLALESVPIAEGQLAVSVSVSITFEMR